MDLKVYKKVFYYSPIMGAITDDKNKIIDVNLSFCNYFNVDKKEVINKHFSLILSQKSAILNIDDQLFPPKNIKEEDYANVWEVETKNHYTRFVAIETVKISDENTLVSIFDLTKEGQKARKNSIDLHELRKYLINSEYTYDQH